MMRSLRGPKARPEGPPDRTRRAGTRAATGTVALVMVAMVASTVGGCGSRADSTETSARASAVVATTRAASPPFTTTTSVGASLSDSPASTWQEVQLAQQAPAEPFIVGLSDELLVIRAVEEGGLYAYPFASERFVRLPVQGRVGAFDVEGSLVVWTESRDASASASTWAYRLPSGPRVEVLAEQIDASGLRLDGGRLFYTSAQLVEGDESKSEELLYRCPISMIRLDATGRPHGNAVLVTEEPKASQGPGGDELWDFDVAGPTLAYQEDWGPERGIHLLDLDTGDRVTLGMGVIPSVSSTTVVWSEIGEDGSRVRSYDLASRQTATLSFRGHMPLAAAGYIAYLQPTDEVQPEELIMLDPESGVRTVLGWWQRPDGWPFLSMAGTDRRFAWVARSSGGDSQLHLFAR